MKKEKSIKIKGITFYIQYCFWHFGLAIDYEKLFKNHNISLLLPFIIIAIEIPIKNVK